MIDLTIEELLSISQALNMLPGLSGATIWRWIATGQLESVKLGGRRFTSREALARMAEHGPQHAQSAPLPLTSKQRQRQMRIQRVDQELDELLGFGAGDADECIVD